MFSGPVSQPRDTGPYLCNNRTLAQNYIANRKRALTKVKAGQLERSHPLRQLTLQVPPFLEECLRPAPRVGRGGQDREWTKCHPYVHEEIEQSAVSNGSAAQGRSSMQRPRKGSAVFQWEDHSTEG